MNDSPVRAPWQQSRVSGLMRWGLSGALVTTLYGGAGYALMQHAPDDIRQDGAPQAILLELTPEDPVQPANSEPLMPETQEAKEQPVEEKPEPEPEPEPQPPPELVEPPPPLPAPKVEPAKAEAILPKQAEKPKPKRIEKPRPEKTRPATRKQTAQAAPSAQPAPTQPAFAGSGGFNMNEEANWRGRLMAQLNRAKQPPAGGGTGTATIAFSIGRNGAVQSASLVRSSGNPALDQAALAMVRRASPLPAPPPAVKILSFVVPVRFNQL